MSRGNPTDLATFVAAPARGKRAEAHRGRPAFSEHHLVSLSSRLKLEDGRTLPAGSTGTVVGIWAEGEAFEVEFAEPFHAVVTIEASKLSRVEAGG